MAWTPEDDVPFVLAAQAGDAASFDVLYRRHLRMVHAVLLGRSSRDEAEDLVQEAFLVAWRRLGTLRDPAAFSGWVLAIARHLHVDHLRRDRAGHRLELAHGGTGARGISGAGTHDDTTPRLREVPSGDAPPDDELHKRLEAQRALEAIRALPDAYRETLLLRLVEGMTGPEIAARTGLTPESVRVNLCRGMKLLRQAIGASPHERPVTTT